MWCNFYWMPNKPKQYQSQVHNKICIYYSFDLTTKIIFMNFSEQDKRAKTLNCIVIKIQKKLFFLLSELESEFVVSLVS